MRRDKTRCPHCGNIGPDHIELRISPSRLLLIPEASIRLLAIEDMEPEAEQGDDSIQ